MKTEHYGYAVQQLDVPKPKAKQAPKAPTSTVGTGYASSTRSMSDRAAPTSVNITNKGKPAVIKGGASIGYSNS